MANEITRRVLAQYEDVRRSGMCNMGNSNCVQRVAFDRGHYELVNFIEDGGYSALLLGYDRERANAAYTDPEFDMFGGG